MPTFTNTVILPDPDISGLNKKTGNVAYFQYVIKHSLSDRKKNDKIENFKGVPLY